MKYEIILRPAAKKQLDELSQSEYLRVSQAVNDLENNPRPFKVKKLAGTDYHRVRTGDIRVVYFIDDKKHQLIIVRVARRNEESYKNL
jgi:mRNA-degrading endonuclease RelE of RelBE toxin-antitoxin system